MATEVIRVRATQPGVYGLYRETGDEFEISESKHYSKRWMEKVEVEPKKSEKAKG